MKNSLKKFSFILSLSLLVAACSDTGVVASSSSQVDSSSPISSVSALDALVVPTEVTTNRINLRTLTTAGDTLVWETSDPRYVSPTGLVIRPAAGNGDKNVKLTVSIFGSSPLIKREYNVLVKEQAALNLVEKRNLDFKSVAVEYVPSNSKIDLHFETGVDFPYVDVKAFVDMLKGAVESDKFSYSASGNELQVTFTYYDEEEDKTYIYNNIFDFAKNTLKIDNFDFFDAVPSETVTEFGKGLEVVDFKETPSKEVIIPLGEYGFDIIQKDGLNLIPFHLANQLYSGQMFNAYYNGDLVTGFDYWTKAADITAMRTSSKSTASMSEALKLKTYQHLALIMDYFYGLKQLYKVDTFLTQLSKFETGMVQGTDNNHYSEIKRFIDSQADLHSWFSLTGHYEPGQLLQNSINDLTGRASGYYNFYYDQATQNYCTLMGKTPYKLIDGGNTALITFNEFNEDRGDGTGTVESIGPLILKAKNQDNVKNIVLNLGCNGGGNVGALIRMLGYLTDELIPLNYINPTDGKTATYYYSNEIQKVDVKWYILTSTITFSAANMMTSIAKENGFAKILGLPSSGGASSIAPTILPSGAIIYISSLSMSASKTYESIEFGIQPDYKMNDFKSETELIAAIKAVG